MHFWRFFVHIAVLMLFMITLVSVSINNKCQCELVLLLWCWELTRVHARQASPSWQGLTWPRQALNSFCCQKWPWTPWSSPLCLLPLLFVPDTKRRILIVCVGHFRGWVAGFRPSSLWASEAKSGLVSLSALGRRHPSPAEALALPPLYLTRTLIRFHQAAPGLCLAHTWLITFSSVSPLLPHPGRWCLSHSLASGSSSSYLRVQKPDACAVPSVLPSFLCPRDNLSAHSLIRTTENSCSLSLATHNLLALFSSCPEKRLIRGWNMFQAVLGGSVPFMQEKSVMSPLSSPRFSHAVWILLLSVRAKEGMGRWEAVFSGGSSVGSSFSSQGPHLSIHTVNACSSVLCLESDDSRSLARLLLWL